ncbi:MAG: FxLYD domain-containing protein [Cyanobacteria bacterium]|nr:FxLYD domain-containing protein [Cyanobacteriota bacterium]MDW8202415.1 FxLYD domain-containing protein [Cyanobacteriota bacterium SKYGB_h_bin112]
MVRLSGLKLALRHMVVLVLAGMFWLVSWVNMPWALALIQVELTDISYHECPPELATGNVTSGGNALPANCFIVTGKAKNTSNKPLVNADVYGRIYDANGDPVMQNRTRLGSIAEIPPGVSDFELRISVPANQPTPLQLKQFKATGFTGTVRR